MKQSGLTSQRVIEAVNEIFTDAVVATDVGQNQLWTTQFLALDKNRQMLTSGGLGTMGYGLPAANYYLHIKQWIFRQCAPMAGNVLRQEIFKYLYALPQKLPNRM